MAKKFAGFKPETMHNKILPALGYNGPKDQKSINAFLAASPSAAAKMGKYTMIARQMVEGKPVVNANIGTQIASLNPFAGFGTRGSPPLPGRKLCFYKNPELY